MAPIVGGMVDRARAARFRPDDWIAMGALAISALAGTTLIGSAGGGIRPGIRTISLGVWAGACLWVPLLVRLDVRAALAGRRRLPDAHRWSMVFPLGMLSAASQAVGDAETLPAVRQVGQGVMWVALIAWAMVAAG